MEVEYETDERCGITLVEVQVRNPDPTDRTIQVTPTVDRPVLPPRVDGHPADGWDESGYEGVIEARGQLPLGFAVTGTAPDPPVEVEVVHGPGNDGDRTAVRRVLQQLGDPRPPRTPDPESGTEIDEGERSGSGANGDVPPAIDAWFERIATRLQAGEPVARDRVAAVAERAVELRDRDHR